MNWQIISQFLAIATIFLAGPSIVVFLSVYKGNL